MDFSRIKNFIADKWAEEALPTLLEYMRSPCVSPSFEPNWAEDGHMDNAATLLARWATNALAGVAGARVDIVRAPGRTPLLLIDIPADQSARDKAVIIYGHLDKQPEMEGWSDGRSAWEPSIEGDRIYGRGGADDGYSIFSAILAIRSLADQGLPRPACTILIEGSEESGSTDLPYYLETYADRLPAPALVVALDSMCATYDQLWVTTSLRGQVAGQLCVRTLAEAMHSGEASGIVPSPFRVARQLLDRLEDAGTGEIIAAFQSAIPDHRQAEADAVASALASAVYDQMPFVPGAKPTIEDPAELLLNRSWRPQLTVTGIDGIPDAVGAPAVLQPAVTLRLSLRLPPDTDPQAAAASLKALLEDKPPHGAEVSFEPDMVSPGWHAPRTAPWLSACLDAASMATFGKPAAYYGGGGGIPFLDMLGQRFPDAQFVVTGVLGPHSNAHGPNEFLHVPTALHVTGVLAQLLTEAARG